MIAICWDHWRPAGWPRLFPFEVFLFFFLVLSGYLITGSLLRERERKEAIGGPWKMKSLKTYQVRRGLRILAPYYVSLLIALLIGAPDLQAHTIWYIAHLSNIHMATLAAWPPGTNHFWSLSIQQQFYVVWPFVIWFTPKKWRVGLLVLITCIGPISRFNEDYFGQFYQSPELLSWMTLDYFGIGALLAVAMQQPKRVESLYFELICWLGFLCYAALMIGHHYGLENWDLRPLQQTFLSLALCGVIVSLSKGNARWAAWWCEHPWTQKIGQLSYGIYLFHNLAPLLSGKVFWYLWFDPFMTIWGEILKIVSYIVITWGLSQASWKWIENPLQQVRARLREQ